jgi:ATP-dependent protease Clp ATPase subunit
MEKIECSFCGKSVHKEEAKSQFVAGPDAFICRGCVELTIEIFGMQDQQWGKRMIDLLKKAPKTT